MAIDRDRIQAILKADHSYYGSRELPIRRDTRGYPGVVNYLTHQLSPGMNVLDVGCGNGELLLELSPSFQAGLGIDTDPAHITMAEEAKRLQGIQKVDFRLLHFPQEIAHLPPESFDVLVSLRGPVPETVENIQSARRLLRPAGLLFCEEIAELHHKEVVEIFGDQDGNHQDARKVDQVRGIMEQNGFDVRLAADLFTKWLYPDVYTWLEFLCNIWTWLGIPLPTPDDPRLQLFADRNTIATGEIETTHHVAWMAGVKK